MRSRDVFLAVTVALALMPWGRVLAAPKPSAAPGARPPANFKLKPGADGGLCLECHMGTMGDVLKRPFVHTPVKSRHCTGCHNPHDSDHGKLLAAQGNDACVACHPRIVPKEARSSHRPIADKGCVTCHDPHASAHKFNLVKAEGDLCASCHKPVAEAAAKAKVKHRPVEQSGCTPCHDPHGSAKTAKLLKKDVTALCLGCHDVEKPILTKKHMNYPVAKARCTSCHDPHGSDRRGMLYNRVHAPVAKAMCAQCHEPAGSPRALRTRAEGAQLCRGCHAQKMTQMADKARLHRPVAEGDCLVCHGPHASPAPGLLRASGVIVCGACHEDSVRRQALSPTKHQPVRDGACTTCHDPHASDVPLMFVQGDIVEMCGTCHDWLRHSSHPMGDKYKDPRNKNLTIQCLSCHRSHGTEYKHMMPYPTTSELCTKCHEKFTR